MNLTKTSPLISKSSQDYLFHHILDGYKSSHEGIVYARDKGLLTETEVTELLTKNGERLIKRLIEFKAIERLVCVFFAALFGFMQLTGEGLEMRRMRNLRVRRRNETELTR